MQEVLQEVIQEVVFTIIKTQDISFEVLSMNSSHSCIHKTAAFSCFCIVAECACAVIIGYDFAVQ